MPAQQPFTTLCQLAAQARPSSGGEGLGRADLHLHTTHSDGVYLPVQVVELAVRSGLCAIAITDHDTLGGIAPARTAAAELGLEVVAGVEISAEYQGRELHLLGYFVTTAGSTARPLTEALERIRLHRVERYREMLDRLRSQGVDLPEQDQVSGTLLSRAHQEAAHAIGRRHLAELLVRQGRVATVREAFSRYLHDGGRAVVPKRLLAVAEAIRCVRVAGGVASWAHPRERCTLADLAELREMGLGAVEVEYPGFRPARVKALRGWAHDLGLAVTGGSDCHGPGQADRAVGARSVSREELEALRSRAMAVPE